MGASPDSRTIQSIVPVTRWVTKSDLSSKGTNTHTQHVWKKGAFSEAHKMTHIRLLCTHLCVPTCVDTHTHTNMFSALEQSVTYAHTGAEHATHTRLQRVGDLLTETHRHYE